MGGGGGQVFNRPSFSFVRTVYPVQLRFFWDVLGFWLPFLQEQRTPVRGRMSVTPLCWLAGWLAAAEQSFCCPGSLCAAGFFFSSIFIISSFPFLKMSFQPAFVSPRVFCAH